MNQELENDHGPIWDNMQHFPEETEKNLIDFRWANHCPNETIFIKVQHWFWYGNTNKTSDILFTQNTFHMLFLCGQQHLQRQYNFPPLQAMCFFRKLF